MAFTLSVIVPAYNEEEGLPATLESLLRQTEPADAIYVVDDGSSDRTAEVARAYPGVTVLQPDHNLGSKAKAQNYALPFCKDTQLVLPVDADTVLSPDYIRLVKEPFDNDDVAIAAGNVQTRFTKHPTERGRQIEYLFGFHMYRPIQNMANAPVVCSGCCSVFRWQELTDFGGFPERTIVEDFDYTWTKQIAGRRAIYVGKAEAYAADPETVGYLKKQMWRWMAGFFQNMRIHMWQAIRHKPMLATWGLLAIWEILTAPIWWTMPIWAPLIIHMAWSTAAFWFIGVELAMTLPVVVGASIRRKLNPFKVLLNVPFVYFNKGFNCYYAWKGMVVELVLVPLKLAKGLSTYEKGR